MIMQTNGIPSQRASKKASPSRKFIVISFTLLSNKSF